MGIDAALLKERIHAECARLIWHDRHDVLADRFILEQRGHQRDNARCRGNLAPHALLNEAHVVG